MVSFTTALFTIAALSPMAVLAKSGQATFFFPGLGACGKNNNSNDLIVALPVQYWTTANPNLDPVCGRKIEVTRNGKSVTARVVDKCPADSCPGENIDLSPAAFDKIGNRNEGRVQVSWKFV